MPKCCSLIKSRGDIKTELPHFTRSALAGVVRFKVELFHLMLQIYNQNTMLMLIFYFKQFGLISPNP